MSQFAFSDSLASMPNPNDSIHGNNSNNSAAKLLERLRAAEDRAETYRLGKLQLVHDLEQGFSKVCEFMQEQYGKSPDEEVTARWFKHIISDLRTSCEKEANENTVVTPQMEPMQDEDSAQMQKFTESDANFLDNMDLGFSGTNYSFSPRGVGDGTSFPNTAYGNNMASFPVSCKPAPKTMVRQTKSKSKGFVASRGEKNNGKTKKKKGTKSVFYCAICNKSFAGASGLWYHNKHVHNAVTQSRPRNKNKNSATNNRNVNEKNTVSLDSNKSAIASY